MTTTTTMTADEILAAAARLEGSLVALTTLADEGEPTFYKLTGAKSYADGSAGGGSLELRWPDPEFDHVNVLVLFASVVELREMTDAEFAAAGWGF